MPSKGTPVFLVAILTVAFGFLNVGVPAFAASKETTPTSVGDNSASPIWPDWLEYGFGPQHLGLNPYEHVLGPETVAHVVELWSNPNVGASNFYWYLPQPVVTSGLVYYCGAGLCAIDISTGAIVWTALTDTDFWTNMPAVAGNMIYMGSPQTGILYALNATTGDQIWTFQTYATWDQPFSAPTVVNGVVYFGAGDLIYALDATTGVFLWTYPTEEYVSKSSPALANGMLYEASTTIAGYLYALNASTGEYIWSYPGGTSTSPVISNGIVYFTPQDQNVSALNADTGAFLWSFGDGQTIERTPVVDNGVLYVLSDSSTLYALNAQTGSVLWKEHLGGGASENPGHMAIANGVLYVPFNSIDAFDASNGTLLYHSPEIGVDAISVANGAIYAGASLNDTGVLYAFGLPTGEHF